MRIVCAPYARKPSQTLVLISGCDAELLFANFIPVSYKKVGSYHSSPAYEQNKTVISWFSFYMELSSLKQGLKSVSAKKLQSQFNDFEILFSSDLPKKRTKAYKTKKSTLIKNKVR